MCLFAGTGLTQGRRLLFICWSPSRNPAWLQRTAGLWRAFDHPDAAGRERATGARRLRIVTTVAEKAQARLRARQLMEILGRQGTWRRIHPAKSRAGGPLAWPALPRCSILQDTLPRRAQPAQRPRKGTESHPEQHQRCPPPCAQPGTWKFPFEAQKHPQAQVRSSNFRGRRMQGIPQMAQRNKAMAKNVYGGSALVMGV